MWRVLSRGGAPYVQNFLDFFAPLLPCTSVHVKRSTPSWPCNYIHSQLYVYMQLAIYTAVCIYTAGFLHPPPTHRSTSLLGRISSLSPCVIKMGPHVLLLPGAVAHALACKAVECWPLLSCSRTLSRSRLAETATHLETQNRPNIDHCRWGT